VNKWGKYILLIGLLVFFVQQPGTAANVVTLGVNLIQQLIGAISTFVTQLATAFT
jgi:hypothetical protein